MNLQQIRGWIEELTEKNDLDRINFVKKGLMGRLKWKRLMDEDAELISKFNCSDGDEDEINEFIHEKATDLQHKGICMTYLFSYNDVMVGFISLTNGQTLAKSIEGHHTIPTRYYPNLMITNIGVDNEWRGLDISQHMVGLAIKIFRNISKKSGCKCLSLQARERLKPLYEKFGFESYENAKINPCGDKSCQKQIESCTECEFNRDNNSELQWMHQFFN